MAEGAWMHTGRIVSAWAGGTPEKWNMRHIKRSNVITRDNIDRLKGYARG